MIEGRKFSVRSLMVPGLKIVSNLKRKNTTPGGREGLSSSVVQMSGRTSFFHGFKPGINHRFITLKMDLKMKEERQFRRFRRTPSISESSVHAAKMF